MTIASGVIRNRWWILAAWTAAVVALALFVPQIDPSANEQQSLLPDDTPYGQAVAAMWESFPRNNWLSEAVVVFERKQGPLTVADLTAIERIAAKLRHPSDAADSADLLDVNVRSPASIPMKPNPLKSPAGENGQAALIKVGIPANFITLRSYRVVDHIRRVLLAEPQPDGLSVAVTGSSGFGHDYATAARRSHTHTLYVTLAAVILILLAIYRAPIAAMVPLVAISLAAFVALRCLALGQYVGMHVGTAENIFVIVLLYGAGTDYSLFFLSRFREFLDDGLPGRRAASLALKKTLPAILASAGTDTAGLLMLCFAGYGVFRTTGPAVAVALLVALVAAVTLVPIAAALAGRWMFWPGKIGAGQANKLPGSGRRKFWPNLARLVVARPGTVLVVSLMILAVPAVQGMRLTWVYDTLTELKRSPGNEIVGSATLGAETAQRHWPIGEIAPVQLLIRPVKALSESRWDALCGKLTGALLKLPDVSVVRSLTQPVGKPLEGLAGAIFKVAGGNEIRREYVSDDRRAMRLAVTVDHPAFSLEAMEALGRVRSTTDNVLAKDSIDAKLHLAGATAEMIDVRQVTQADFVRVAFLSLGVIFLMVFALVRDAILSAAMVISTVISYFTTLGISYWVFSAILGEAGLDWKVQVFLFVVMVAVGVDYNIFLASRLAQEARRLPHKLAVARAIIHTGPVISSCGLIMAATLGSLMAGDLTLFRQLGFALALGMLIDTFAIRPLVLPAFVTLTRRTGRAPRLGH